MVEDEMLQSGQYYILINASDGKHTNLEYVPISINELEKVVNGYLVVEDVGSFETRISYLTPELTADTSFVLPFNYSTSAIDHVYEQLYFISPEPSQLIAYPLRKSEIEWSIQAALPYPSFNDPIVDNGTIIGSGNGDVVIYDQDGGIVVKTDPVLNHKVEQLAVNKDFIVCELVSLSGFNHYLYTYYRETGGLHRSRSIGGDITAVLTIGKEFLVTIFDGLNTDLLSLEPVENILTVERYLDNMNIKGMEKVNQHTALLYTDEEIYVYDHYYDSFFPYVDVAASGIQFDSVRSTILYYDNEGIGFYSFPDAVFLGYSALDGLVRDFHVIYNK
jgi:hypothetical protein